MHRYIQGLLWLIWPSSSRKSLLWCPYFQKSIPCSLSVQFESEIFNIYISWKSSYTARTEFKKMFLDCVVRSEAEHRSTTGWHCDSRNEHCLYSSWVFVPWPSATHSPVNVVLTVHLYLASKIKLLVWKKSYSKNNWMPNIKCPSLSQKANFTLDNSV